MNRRVLLTVALVAGIVAGCPGAPVEEDAGFPDRGFSDAGFPDAGFPDAGFPDAGFPDAGFPDAGFREYGLEVREENVSCRLDGAPPLQIPTLEIERVFPALTLVDPILIAPVPATGLLYAAERGGDVITFSADGDGADVTTTSVGADLFGAAVGDDGSIYGTTTVDGVLSLRRFDPDASTILDLGPAGVRHGGSLRFGHDGMLYVAVGDLGDASLARDLTSLRGKILRLDVSPLAGYAVPSDNPFIDDVNALPEIFARGVGDPSCAFDRITGRLWCGDRGETRADEVGVVAAGADLGWPRMEAAFCVDPPTNCQDGTLTLPLETLQRATTCAVVGGHVVRNGRLPEIQGAYLFADKCSGLVRALRFDGRTIRSAGDVVTVPGGVAAFGESVDGDVLIVDNAGAIHRLVRPAQSPAPTFPANVTQTGCYSSTPTRDVAPGLIPFEVRAPLWSDGAQKRRFMALPGTETIGFTTSGPWSFPDGTIFMKEFLHPTSARILETRFLIRRSATTWEGYSYMWNREGTEAFLLEGSEVGYWPDDVDATLDGHLHLYPNRAECLLCHNQASGRVLGPVTGRMNTDHDYDGFIDNQLRSMEHIGLFSEPLPAPPAELPRFPNLDDVDVPIEDRARAWIHGNCSHCHQPFAPAPVTIDFRFETPFAETRTCDVNPALGNLGVTGAKIIKPGVSAESVLFLRMSRRGNQQMPPLATRLLEEPAVTTVRDWIDGLAGCP